MTISPLLHQNNTAQAWEISIAESQFQIRRESEIISQVLLEEMGSEERVWQRDLGRGGGG
jgi:hypothetical protein